MNKENTSIHILPTETYFAMVRQFLADQGQASIRVTGNSMWPLLHHLRDSVMIIPPEKIRVGDIVLFDRLNGRYALHRVINKKKNGFSMAGDNQLFFERDLPYEQIVGVAVSIERNGRRISCSNVLIRIYSYIVVFLTKPRIFLRNAAIKILKTIRNRFSSGESGAGVAGTESQTEKNK